MHRVRAHISSTAGHDDPVPFARRPQQVIPIWLRLVHQTRVRGFYRAQEGEGREHWARSCSAKEESEAAFHGVFGAVLAHGGFQPQAFGGKSLFRAQASLHGA